LYFFDIGEKGSPGRNFLVTMMPRQLLPDGEILAGQKGEDFAGSEKRSGANRRIRAASVLNGKSRISRSGTATG
jgi:hypothetical protein